jgi:hypothetical protein
MQSLATTFLQSAIKRLLYYKELADKTFASLDEPQFYFKPNEESNNIAIIIQHMSGNMLSRWTDFLNTDGEKEWRRREEEFEINSLSKEELITIWESGWKCCIASLGSLTENDLLKMIKIRQEPLFVIDAINRQLAHYPYHVGQIIYVGKMLQNEKWETLSIPRRR